MTNLNPVSSWSDVRQLETTDLVLAGPGQVMNEQAQALLNRTQFLQDAISAIGDIEADLRNDTDPTKGTSILGHRMRTAREQLDSICVVPENFGAVGDGVTDDTAAIQSALDFCANFNGSLFDTPGAVYSIVSVKIKNGIRVFDMTKGSIKPTAACLDLNTAAIKMDGPNLYGGTAVRNGVFSARIDMSAGGVMPWAGDAASDNVFRNFRITGYVNHPTLNHYGLLFWYGSSRNKVYNNSIVGVSNPTMRGLLIDFIGQSDPFGNYFAGAGATTRPSVPCRDNIIYGNSLTSGSYGINLLGCEGTIVTKNVCRSQNHRSVYLANSCYFSVIGNNELLDFSSTAVLLGYGCDQNLVMGNNCTRDPGIWPVGTGEAVININTGAQRNIVIGNRTSADTNYGIYLACNTSFNVIKGNDVRGYYLAGIAMESDWEAIVDRPAGAIFSRPNYAAPGTVSPGATQWAFNNLESNTISGNIIREGAAGRSVAGIYVAQVDSNSNLAVIKNNICDNEVYGNADMAYYMYIFEETVGKMVNNKLSGNKFTDASGVPSASKIFISRGRMHFNYQENNDVIDYVTTTFASGDTTPSVAYGGNFAFSNSSATTVTTFDDAPPGLTILVRLGANTTLVHNNAVMRLAGQCDISGRSTNDTIVLKNQSTGSTPLWVEIDRSFSLDAVGSVTYDPPSLAAGAYSAETTVTVPGAVLGDCSIASFSLSLGGLIMFSYVSSANTVTVRLYNPTAGTIDLASGTLRARTIKG